MSCDQSLKVQAYLDGELDALGAAAVEAHLESCAQCQAQCEAHGDLKSALAGAPYYRAPPLVRARITRALDGEKPTRPGFWTGVSGGAGATALAACLAILLLRPAELPADALVDAHLHAMQAGPLIAVVSSDHHTVKPWFSGHADVSPPVTDFRARGFALVGGRSDMVEGSHAAVSVYRHGAHVIDLYAWADRGAALPADTTRKGYHVLFWKQADMDFAAVSDTAPEELSAFAALAKESGRRE